MQLAVIHSLRPCSFASPDFSGYAVFDFNTCNTFYLIFTKYSHLLFYYSFIKNPTSFQNNLRSKKYIAYSPIFFHYIYILYILFISPHAFVYHTLLKLLQLSLLSERSMITARKSASQAEWRRWDQSLRNCMIHWQVSRWDVSKLRKDGWK